MKTRIEVTADITQGSVGSAFWWDIYIHEAGESLDFYILCMDVKVAIRKNMRQ